MRSGGAAECSVLGGGERDGSRVMVNDAREGESSLGECLRWSALGDVAQNLCPVPFCLTAPPTSACLRLDMACGQSSSRCIRAPKEVGP